MTHGTNPGRTPQSVDASTDSISLFFGSVDASTDSKIESEDASTDSKSSRSRQGVLYTQAEIRMAMKGILLRGKLMFIRLKVSFWLHLNWGCTNTKSGNKHRLGG